MTNFLSGPLLKMQLVVLCWLLSLHLAAQAPIEDSLQQELRSATTLQDTARILEQLARNVQYADPGSALVFIQQGREAHRHHRDIAGLIRADVQANLPFVYLNKLDSVKSVAERGIRLFSQLPEDSLRSLHGGLYKNLATYHHMVGDLDSAEVYYGQAIAYLPKDHIAYAGLLLNRSGLYMSKHAYEVALNDLEQAIAFARATDNDRMLAAALGNAATAYYKLDRYDDMETLLLESISLFSEQNNTKRQLDSEAELCIALTKLARDSAYQYCSSVHNRARQRDNGYALLVSAEQLARYHEDSNKDSVRHYLTMAYQNRAAHHDQAFAAHFALRYADQMLDDKLPSRALSLVNEAISFYSQDSTNYIQELGDSYFTQGSAYAKTNQPNAALAAFTRARDLKQLSTQMRLNEQIAKAEVGFRTRETSRNLELERSARVAEAEAATSRQSLLVLGIGGALLIALLATVALLRIRRDRARIAAQNLEREVLLKEIHHRVKNNLQIISGLLAKQVRSTTSEDVKNQLREGQDRVHSMALIHQSLYQRDEFQSINIKEYISELATHLTHSLRRPDQKVEFQLEVADVRLSMDKAIPLGLILNELITNAFKYGFQDLRQGLIRIAFREHTKDESYELVVTNNGHPLREDFKERALGRLGLNLVRGLARQLQGTFALSSPSDEIGVEARVAFS